MNNKLNCIQNRLDYGLDELNVNLSNNLDNINLNSKNNSDNDVKLVYEKLKQKLNHETELRKQIQKEYQEKELHYNTTVSMYKKKIEEHQKLQEVQCQSI